MTNATLGSGDNLAHGREGCVGDLGLGTKAISRPDPNTAATFLSQNDDKKDEMDGRSDGCSGGYGGGGQGGNHQRQKSTVVTNFFPSENFAWVDDAVTWKGGEKDRERGERNLAFGGPSQLAGGTTTAKPKLCRNAGLPRPFAQSAIALPRVFYLPHAISSGLTHPRLCSI